MKYLDDTPMTGNYKSNSILAISNAIRHKKRGVDTREAMAQALEKAFDVASSAVTNPGMLSQEIYEMAEEAYKTSLKKADKNEIEDRLSLISTKPEAFPDAEALKSSYPKGAEGIFVTVDTGHKWIYSNGSWSDFGVYQAAGEAGFSKTIIWNSLNSTTNVNSLSTGKYYIAIAPNNKKKATYFHDVLNLPYFIDGKVALGSLSVTLTSDQTGGYQTLQTSSGVWTRAKSAGTWTEWHSQSDIVRTVVWNSLNNTENANDLSTGKYFVAIDGTDKKIAKYLHENLNLPKVDGLEHGMLTVDVNDPTKSFGGIQTLITNKNVYVRTAINSVWGSWTSSRNSKAVPEFSQTIVLNSKNNTENANSLGGGVYFIAIDASSEENSEYFAKTLNWPKIASVLEVGVLYSQVNDSGDGSQILVTDKNIYIRTNAKVLSDTWTVWKTVGETETKSNKTVFLGDSRMAGLLGNGKGYAEPRPYEIISKNNNLTHSGHAVSGTGYVYSVEGTNAQTTANAVNFSAFDNVVIAYGINDYLKNAELGTANDSQNTNTVIGGLLSVLKKVYNDNDKCNVVVVLPFNTTIRGTVESRYALDKKNSAVKPYTLKEMQDLLADICEKYEIPYVDTRKGCSINLLNIVSVMSDGLHPTSSAEYATYSKWLSAQVGSLLQPMHE